MAPFASLSPARVLVHAQQHHQKVRFVEKHPVEGFQIPLNWRLCRASDLFWDNPLFNRKSSNNKLV